MPPGDAFHVLVERLTAGDAAAAEELVVAFEPDIRRFIHFRLTDPRVREVCDTLDVFQSVLGKFLGRLRAGTLRFDHPAKLRGYLRDLAEYKIRDLVADLPKEQQFPEGSAGPYDPAGGSSCDPGKIVENADVLALVRRRLAADERYLFDQYRLGRSWPELAAELGKKPDALRKQLAYAIDKASRALGLRDDADE